MKFGSKEELINRIDAEHQRLVELLWTIPEARYLEGGVWGDGWNIRDLLAHLTEWEQMFLSWFRDGQAGRQPDMPARGFKWNQTPALNRKIWKKHKQRTVAEIMAEFETSYEEIFSLAQRLSAKELLEPGRFAWTGKNSLTTYLGANTVSHYRTATRILRRWLRATPEAIGSESGEHQ